jgi:predicted GIY-YIG superfamily endonuclease
MNIAKNMANMIIETTRKKDEQIQDLNKLNEILINSNYPPEIAQKLITEALRSTPKNSITKNTTTHNQDQKDEHILCLPYVPGIEILKRRLAKLNIKLFYSYPNKLQSTLNSSVKRNSKSVIYQIKCECGKIYNGETKIGLENRIKQHEKLINKNEIDSKSEIVQHHYEKKHQCSFNTKQAFMIENEINWKKRRIKETLYSNINQSINKRDDLYRGWIPILHTATSIIRRKIELKEKP